MTNSFQSATLKVGDSTTIVLKTQSQLLTKSYIPVSYFPGNQASADDGLLELFGPVYINGYVSTYLSSKTSKDGRYISVAFNKKLADTSVHISNFIIKVDNVNNIVTQASLNGTKDTLYLTLTNRIVKSTDVISITYQPGSLLTTDGFIVAGFNNKTVANLVLVPSFVSAATSSDGATLQLGFSQSIADPTGQESAFMVTVNAKNNQVTNAELLDSNNKDVILTLSSGIYNGDTISIVYNPGSLVSSLGVPVPAFSAAVNNNSTSKPTVIQCVRNNNIECYPNPFGDQLFISNPGIYQSIAIKDMFGRKVIQLTLNQNGITAISTSALASGIYVVTLSNSNDQLALKVLKL